MVIELFQKINKYNFKLSGFNKNNQNSFKSPLFIIVACLILGLLLFAYSNHFSNSFHFDDSHTIESNSAIQELNITNFFRDATTFSSLPTNQSYRPLTTLENAIDYKIAGGLNPKIFHVHIFIIFLVVCILLCVFIKKILDKINFSNYNQFWALLNAAIFGLLCANAETVNYIIQRAEITSAMFVIAGFVAFLSGGFWRTKCIYLLFPFIGFFAKEMAFVFAPLLFLYLLLFEEKVDLLHFYRQEEFKKVIKSFIKIIPAFTLTVVFYIFYTTMLPATFSPGGLSQSNYLITQPMVMVHYIVTYFIPYNLSVDTDWTVYTSIFDYRALAGIVLISILFYIALKASKEKETRLFSFGILWFFISLLPTSSFIPFAEVLNDHRSFIPYIGLTFAFVFGLNYLIQKYFFKSIKRKSIQTVIGILIIIFLGANTYGVRERNKIWKDDLSLWKDASLKSPNNGRGLMNYGLALMEKGDYNNAEKYFNKGLLLNPNYSSLYINLGIVNNAKGNKTQAEKHFKKAIELLPLSHKNLFFYGRFLVNDGRVKEGEKFLLNTLKISPSYSTAQILLMKVYHHTNEWGKLNNLALKILESLPNNKEALKYLDIAINEKSMLKVWEKEAEKYPTPEKYLNLSLKYFQNNNFKETILAANIALDLKNNYYEAYNNIGIANYMLGEYNKAIEAYNIAINLKPNYNLAKNNLANAIEAKEIEINFLKNSSENLTSNDYLNLSLMHYNKGNFRACINTAKKVNKIIPNSAAYNNICAAYNELKEYDKAIEACKKAIKLDANHSLAKGNLNYAISQKK
jgi:tetratricopeptide (TPR) repeat protein